DKLHLATLTRAQVGGYLDEFCAMPLVDRRRLPGLEPGRADVVIGGALVLEVVMDVFGYGSLVHSEKDILDGLASDLARRLSASDPGRGRFSGPSLRGASEAE
ncbi:MAG TPA: hypothetical protein VG368_00505, partial [Acidimicrobiales bacterium]|nr:hypothetical protein [Acidimicrobiales bacterium]